MKLEKTILDEIQQILKLGSAIKVIPWTAGESSRSKMIIEAATYYVCTLKHLSTIKYKLP